ncbi:hypothetical protein BHM03_00031135 [Ensete ventricosum]|uniref:Uncharacterized protein n=1 Tax=Ensete ventricosum TaxID=4639 RepID=A0A445MIN2_ENSVE|nr:hypothetical protein BHM03_00031135 [Ensete ventricosum]
MYRPYRAVNIEIANLGCEGHHQLNVNQGAKQLGWNLIVSKPHEGSRRPYRPVRTGPTADRYADRSLSGSTAKIDHRRLIKGEIDHRRLIGEEKGKKKKKKKKYIARAPSLPTGRPCTLVACGSPANRCRPRVAREPSLPLGRPQALAARGERDQGNVAMDSSVMGMAASWYHRGETSVETSIPCSHEGRALVVNGAKNMENVKANPSTKTRLKGKGQRTS